MSTYEATLKIIFSLKACRSTNGVQDVRTICESLGSPESSFKIIHITGTNGKGTVSRQAAGVLMHQGYKTGLIISPHIISFRERITVNFEEIPESYILEAFSLITSKFSERGLSYSFEQVVFILGLLYLRDCQVDYAVIEVGCGGARDSSNIVDPVVSVITSVGLDHTHMLGNTVEEIAVEKAGVFKHGRPCVVGPNTPRELLRKIAEEKGARIYEVEERGSKEESFVEENSRITRKIFEVIEVGEGALEEGLKCTQPFRYQRLRCRGKDVVLDVGHNPMALDRVFRDVRRDFGKGIRVCLAISKGRDPDEFITLAFKHCSAVHAVSTQHIRILSHTVLEESAAKFEKTLDASGGISEILSVAVERANDEVVLVIGSCYIIEAAVLCLTQLGACFDNSILE